MKSNMAAAAILDLDLDFNIRQSFRPLELLAYSFKKKCHANRTFPRRVTSAYVYYHFRLESPIEIFTLGGLNPQNFEILTLLNL